MNRRVVQGEVVAAVLKAKGYPSLNPTQQTAVRSGLLKDDGNFVVASPTASGKTVIGELAIIEAVQKGSKGVYLVPLRSLGTEKFEDFSEYKEYKVALRTGDYDSREDELDAYDIIISTYEKWDSILRHRPDWLQKVGCVVADEGHMLTDESRGSTIEVLLTRMTALNIRVVVLSAVLRNVEEVAGWLGAKIVKSAWRPTPLRKGVYLFKKKEIGRGHKHTGQDQVIESRLEFEDGEKTQVRDTTGNAISNLVLETLKRGGQCLVFARGRSEAIRLATFLGGLVENGLTPNVLVGLSQLSSSGDLLSLDTETSRKLVSCVSRGVGFHHAGMTSRQKRLVEKLFRDLKLKVVCSTPTLSQGVNLPARRVIIQTIKRFDIKLGWVTLPRWEFENQAGRAGRPKYDDFGEAIVVSKDERQMKQILEYIRQPIEELESKLTIATAFYSHVLSEICLSESCTLAEVQTFFGKTFAAHTGGADFVSSKVVEAINFLRRNGLIEADPRLPGRLVKTRLGDRVSRLYISPLSIPMVLRAFEASETKPITTIGLLHLMCCMDDWRALILTGRDERRADWPPVGELLVDEKLAEGRYELAMRPSLMMQLRIDEVDPKAIFERFRIGEGDVHVATESAKWLLYSLREIAKFTHHYRIIPPIDLLSRRVEDGVKEELLSLTTIRGIGAKRARRLWIQGVKTKEEFERLSNSERDRLLGFRFGGDLPRTEQRSLSDY